MKQLEGKRTYIVAAVMVILAGLKAQGYISEEQSQMIYMALSGLGLAFLRAGVTKENQKTK